MSRLTAISLIMSLLAAMGIQHYFIRSLDRTNQTLVSALHAELKRNAELEAVIKFANLPTP